MTKLASIEGIGDGYEAKLVAAGIHSVEDLLEMGATPAGRKDLESKTAIRHDLLLRWINHADLYRIQGVGAEFAELLEAAGVDTVAELAQRNPANLHVALVEKNTEKKLVRRLPSEEQVTKWVDEAKVLPRIISY